MVRFIFLQEPKHFQDTPVGDGVEIELPDNLMGLEGEKKTGEQVDGVQEVDWVLSNVQEPDLDELLASNGDIPLDESQEIVEIPHHHVEEPVGVIQHHDPALHSFEAQPVEAQVPFWKRWFNKLQSWRKKMISSKSNNK